MSPSESIPSLLARAVGPILVSEDTWAGSLYLDSASESAINQFLTESGEYKDGSWARLPRAPTRKSQLRKSLCRIIDYIIRYFSPKETQSTRMAVDARVDSFYCEPTGSSTPVSCFPDIVIKASGPSFSTPKMAPLGFSNVTTCLSVSVKGPPTDESLQVARMAGCAKHTFIQQPNRNFVRSITVTGSKVRLFHFDRSGAQHSPPFDINDDPQIFIRLILGLSSFDERTLGLDDTIQWTIGPDGQKVAGTIKTLGPDNTVFTYDLVMDRGPITRTSLCGRGTTCWVAQTADGEEVLVKDYWVTQDPPSEVRLLDEVQGLPGVCQMLSHEDNLARTKNFRGETTALEGNISKSRTKIRIVMQAYGRTIEKFTSVTQFLSAFRDAIAAHKALLDKDIIHRDISPNNILLGLDGADEGDRGVLIDLDHAVKSLGLSSEVPVDFQTGTRAFLSLMVLQSYNLKPAFIPGYNYLDDIEAFFWVFAYIILTYTPNGHRIPYENHRKCPEWLWSDGDPCTVFARKWNFLMGISAENEIEDDMHPGWKATCCDLFFQFREYVNKIAYEKQRLVYKGRKELGRPVPDRFASILGPVDEHYSRILGMFDAALEKAAEVGVDEFLSVPLPPLPAPGTHITTSSQSSTSRSVEPAATSRPTTSLTEGSLILSAKPETHSEQPVTPPRTSKRRYDEAELDDFPVESKRRCPPSRRAFRGILSSVYGFCRSWF